MGPDGDIPLTKGKENRKIYIYSHLCSYGLTEKEVWQGGGGMGRKQRISLILALVLLTALAAAFLVQRKLLGQDGAKAVIQVGGQGKQELDLSKDQEFWVGDPEIGRNLIRVEDGAVMVAQADCPDKICVHTGPISREGEVIACLPHGVIIYIPWEVEAGP